RHLAGAIAGSSIGKPAGPGYSSSTAGPCPLSPLRAAPRRPAAAPATAAIVLRAKKKKAPTPRRRGALPVVQRPVARSRSAAAAERDPQARHRVGQHDA